MKKNIKKIIKKQSKNDFSEINKDYLIIFSILIYSVMVWWGTRNLPYFWDSAGFVIAAARNFWQNNFANLVPTGSDFAHPPFYIAMLALSWKFLGNSILVSHLFNFMFLPILMIATYYIGKRMSSWRLGLGASFLIGTTPVVLAEYGVIYLDLSMAALFNLAIALMLWKKYWASGIILALAILTKIPAVMFFIIWIWLWIVRKEERKNWKFYLPVIFGLGFLGIWLYYHYQQTGWFYKKPGRGMMYVDNLAQLWSSLSYVFGKALVKQNRLIVLILGIIGWLNFKSNKVKNEVNRELWGMGLLIILGIGFFAYVGEFAARYGIFFLPSFYIVAFYPWDKMKKKEIWGGALIFCLLLFVFAWHPKIENTKRYEFAPPEDLSYQDMIKIGQESSEFLFVNYQNAIIYGSWPEGYQLTETHQGYIKKALEFKECKEFQLNSERDQLVMLHAYSPGQMTCRQLMDLVKMSPVIRFEENGKWVEIWKVSDDYKNKETASEKEL